MTPAQCLKYILHRLSLMTIGFHATLIVAVYVGLPEGVIETLKGAATLTLGAYIAILRDIADDKEQEIKNNKKPPDINPREHFSGDPLIR